MSSALASIARNLSVAWWRACAALQKSPRLQAVRSLSNKQRLIVGSLCVLVVASGMQFVIPFAFSHQSCPAQGALLPKLQRSAPPLTNGPIALLKSVAQVQLNQEGKPRPPEAVSLLLECARWKPTLEEALPPLAEVSAQIQCINFLMQGGQPNGNKLGSITPSVADSSEHYYDNAIHSVRGIVWQCQAIHSNLLKARGSRRPAAIVSERGGERPVAGIAASFSNLASLETPARDALRALQYVESHTGEGETLKEITSLRSLLRGCVVDAVREARSIAGALPRAAKPSSWFGRSCKVASAPLAGVEKFAVEEATAESDSDIVFNAGLLMSQAAMASNDILLFGDSAEHINVHLDQNTSEFAVSNNDNYSGFANVPRAFLIAEALLLRGLEASRDDQEKNKRASSSAGVIAYHAKFLMELGSGWEGIAEQRYRAAARIALKHGRDKLAAHSLAQLGYFLSLRGMSEEALAASEEAVDIDAGDPLAIYLRATLRLSTGAIRTSDAAIAAKNELAAVKGRLPNPRLEDEREAAHSTLMQWLRVARATSVSVCLSLGDVADILICVAAKFAYA